MTYSISRNGAKFHKSRAQKMTKKKKNMFLSKRRKTEK